MSAKIVTVIALVAVVAAQVHSLSCATKGGQSYYSQGSFKGQPAAQWHQSSQQYETQHYQAPLPSLTPFKGNNQQVYQAPAVGSKGGSFSYQQEQRLESGPSAQLDLPAQTVQQPALAPTEPFKPEQRLEISQTAPLASPQVEAQSEMVTRPAPSVSEQRFESAPLPSPSKGFYGQSYSSGQTATFQRPEVTASQPVAANAQVEMAPAMPLANAYKA